MRVFGRNRPLARLHFNRSVKYLGLFDGDKEERVKVDTLDEIYDHAERLRATAREYVAPAAVLASGGTVVGNG